MAWSVNCRLLVAQLTLALIVVYLYNISKVMQLDRLHRQHLESDHLPHPVLPRRGIEPHQTDPHAEVWRTRLVVWGIVDAAARRLRRCHDARKPTAVDAVWQRQDHRSGTIFIYSAVYDERRVKRDPDSVTVRLLVLASGLEDQSTGVYCQVWYAEVPEPAVVRADIIELDADTGRRMIGRQIYVQYLISCLLEQSATTVEDVSVVVGNRCRSASTLVPVHRPDAATETTEVGICGVLAWPVSGESTHEPLQSAPWLVEWMELQLTVFGASRVFLYVAFDDDLRPLKQLIRLYADRKKSLIVRHYCNVTSGRWRYDNAAGRVDHGAFYTLLRPIT